MEGFGEGLGLGWYGGGWLEEVFPLTLPSPAGRGEVTVVAGMVGSRFQRSGIVLGWPGAGFQDFGMCCAWVGLHGMVLAGTLQFAEAG